MKGGRKLGWCALTIFALVGCGSAKTSQPARSSTLREPTLLDELSRAPDALVKEVARLRGLEARAPIPIALDTDEAFQAALAEKDRHDALEATASQKTVFYVAFGFPLSEERAPAHRPAAVRDEELVGFYDQITGVVHVRASRLHRTSKELMVQRGLIAHEIEHALQHQHFGPVDTASLDTDEARLSRFAVLEGDAMVVMVGHVADKNHVPLVEALEKLARGFEDGTLERSMMNDPNARALKGSAPNEREKLLFPYTQGMLFMGALYRAGGNELMNAAFSRPPSSTEQVIHPEKYLAGEPPLEIPTPKAPSGFHVAVSGVMGELLSSVVLGQCSSKKESREAAKGWGGDVFAIVRRPDNALGVLWRTSWDDEASAIRFETASNKLSQCWEPGGRRAKKYSISNAFRVVRRGMSVAFVRGLEEDALDEVAKELLELPILRP